MERDQFRELSLLTQWWGLHASLVNADRLYELVSRHSSKRVRAYWAALASQKRTDPRFRRFVGLMEAGKEVHLLRVGSAFQLARRGEDVRFAGGQLHAFDAGRQHLARNQLAQGLAIDYLRY